LLIAPAPLAEHHQVDQFDCGVDSLNDWLRRRARANQTAGASRTYVVCDGAKVVAYYALASGSVDGAAATGRFRRNMPQPIPVAILGRLAVARAFEGRGLGRALIRDAAERLAVAADVLGIRGLVVHAISNEARAFYLAIGLDPSPINPMTLMISLSDLRAALDASPHSPR
jgi:GNAT superfamily N-acetyltransferase